MISTETNMGVVGEVGTGKEALDIIPRLRPDIVVMDLLLPDISGSDVIKTVCRGRYPFRFSSSKASNTRFFSEVSTNLALTVEDTVVRAGDAEAAVRIVRHKFRTAGTARGSSLRWPLARCLAGAARRALLLPRGLNPRRQFAVAGPLRPRPLFRITCANGSYKPPSQTVWFRPASIFHNNS